MFISVKGKDLEVLSEAVRSENQRMYALEEQKRQVVYSEI